MQATILQLCLISLSALSSAEGPGGHVENYEPSPYHYEYKVHDDKEYLDFGAEEEGDGKGDVHGEYHVQLPDGRLQHVSYRVDDYSGYVAQVSYDGHAEHPSYHGHSGQGAGHRFGKALTQNIGTPSLSAGSASSRLGKSLAGNTRKQSFSDDFFGSSSRHSLSSPSDSSSISSNSGAPEGRELSFVEPTEKQETTQFASQNSQTQSSRRTFVSKTFGFEKQQPKPVKHEFFQHKQQEHTFPNAGNSSPTQKQETPKSRKFVSTPSSVKTVKTTGIQHDDHKVQEEKLKSRPTSARFTSSKSESNKARQPSISTPTNFEKTGRDFFQQDQNSQQPKFNGRPIASHFTSIKPKFHKARKSFFSKPFSLEKKQPNLLKQEASGASDLVSKPNNSNSNHVEPIPATKRIQGLSSGTSQNHPVLSIINSLRSDPVGQKNLKHKSSLIVHRPLPTN